MKRLVIYFVLVVAACGPLPPLETPFDKADFDRYKEEGTCAVTGQAFLKTRGGDVKYGAGNTVQLIPYTTMIREMREKRKNFQLFQKPDQAATDYIQSTFREAIADGNGNFEFTDIPAGDYLLECTITWKVLNQTTGGTAEAIVSVKEGETKKVVLTSP